MVDHWCHIVGGRSVVSSLVMEMMSAKDHLCHLHLPGHLAQMWHPQVSPWKQMMITTLYLMRHGSH